MADTRVKIVDIQVRYQEAVEAMAKYRASLAEVKKYQKDLKKELSDGKITKDQYDRSMAASSLVMRQQSDTLRVLTTQVRNQIKAEQEQTGSLVQLRSQLSVLTKQYDTLSRAERESAKGEELKNKVNALTTEIKVAEEETQRFYRNVGNYKDAARGFEGLTEKARGLGNVLLPLVGISGGAIGLSTLTREINEAGSTFNDQMAKVRAVTNAGTEDFKMMREEAMRLGSQTRYTATQAAEGLENLTRNGLTTAEATATLEGVLHLAQANVIELGEAADIVTGQMNAFHLGVSQVGHINDVLSKTSASSATNISLLNESLRNSAPLAYTLGISLEETSAALGTLAKNNIKGAQAGTNLRQVLMGLTSPTKAQQKAFEAFNITIDQNTIRQEGLIETLRRLHDSGIMQASDSMDKLSDIFGRKAAPAALALLNSLDGLDDMMQKVGEAAGTTDRMFEQSFSDYSVALDSMKSAWESLLITIFDNSVGNMSGAFNKITQFITWIKENFEDVKRVVGEALAAFTLVYLFNKIKGEITSMSSYVVSNAQAATERVNTLAKEEVAIRKNIENLKVQAERASGEERILIERKILIEKERLAEKEKLLHKAKTQEIKAVEEAAAYASGNAWERSMITAKVAVQNFVRAASATLKGFVATALITTAFEALNKIMGSTEEQVNQLSIAESNAIRVRDEARRSIEKDIKAISEFNGTKEQEQIMIQQLNNKYGDVFGTYDTLSQWYDILRENSKQYIIMLGKQIEAESLLQQATEARMEAQGYRNQAKTASTGVGDAIADMIFSGKNGGPLNLFNWRDLFEGSYQDRMTAESRSLYERMAQTLDEHADLLEQQAIDNYSEAAENAYKKMGELIDGLESQTTSPTVTPPSGDPSGGKGDSAKKRAELERKALEEAEKAMLALMHDTATKRRLQLENQYNAEIRKLEVRLKTEKNLTETARDAIEQTILMKKKKLQDELEKLEDAELKREIQNRQKFIESRLSIAQKGSEAEMKLKQEQNNNARELALLAIKDEEENLIEDAKEKLKLAQDAYGAESEQAIAAQEALTAIVSEFTERRNNISEAARQKNLELEQQYQQQLIALRQQAFQNQITELEIQNQQRILKEQEDSEIYLTQQEGIEMMRLEVVTQGEMDVLALRQQAAEQKYNDIIAAGQLEGETVEAYNARVLAAEKAKFDAKAAYRKAELTNEKAYLQASKSITSSLISLTSAIGESNEEFAMLSKVLTLMQIAIDTGKAISGGVASASSLPYPANLAAIATTVATVLANIATAITTVKSAKFAEGGKVTGPGTGTSDSIPARLSNGEFVMTAKATNMFEPLLTAMNAIGAGVIPLQVSNGYREAPIYADELRDSFVEAASNIHPVVSVVEINEAQQQVELIESLDNI